MTDSPCSPKVWVPVTNPLYVFSGNRLLECASRIERSCYAVIVEVGVREIQVQHGVHDGRPGRLRVFQEFAHVLGQGGIRCFLDAPPTWVLPLLFLIQECLCEYTGLVAGTSTLGILQLPDW